MNILICDDDKAQVELLKSYIIDFFKQYHQNIPDISVFYSGEELLSYEGDMDLVFLDIELPGFDGIYVGNELTKSKPNIIIFIITSYMEYLDAAMRFKVFRYLSKPIDKQRLYINLKDALQAYRTNLSITPIETKSGIYSISTHNIIMVEAENKKTTIYTTEGTFNSIHTITYWDDNLTEQCFFRSHRSFIVNFDYINHFDHTTIYLYNKKITAYLTRRKYSFLKTSYLLYLESKR